MSAGEPGVLILADDLTGACDAGVAFAARGLATHVELRDRPPAPLERGAVVSIDLASRMADRDAIHRRVAEALGGAGLRAADELLLKIDSTLRGPIGAHIDAVFAMAGDRVAFVAAAVPSHGRTTVAGIQLVHGVAVDSTEAARDPHVPVGSSAIAAAVGRPSAQIGLATIRAGDSILRRAVDAALARRRIVIFDATEDADLAAVVRVQTAFPQAFWVGAAGIAAQLAARRPRGATIDTGGLGRGPIAFVVGSPSAVAQAQVRALAADGVATEWIAPAQLLAGDRPQLAALAAELRAGRDVALALSPVLHRPPALVRADGGTELDRRFASLIEHLDGPPATIFATCGGETTRAVCGVLGVRRLRLIEEPVPGVVRAQAADGASRLLTKAGAFGDEQTLRAIRNHVRERRRL